MSNKTNETKKKDIDILAERFERKNPQAVKVNCPGVQDCVYTYLETIGHYRRLTGLMVTMKHGEPLQFTRHIPVEQCDDAHIDLIKKGFVEMANELLKRL